ncbi:nuclear transport factor 2 family protein [Sphingomonas sp. ERG5]|uniref:nuclear transport factor 2 family protein n=1 Tax=Sphingomonas sp. ERG5 TaxID=1381597 RepID=UPI0009DDFD53|nr:nuclear transport factor 2 family protein [Sphingomonas sp. ERG5]
MPAAGKDDDIFAVAQAERALAEAHLNLDMDVIDRLIHPDYVIVQPGGAIETKSEVLASYRTGTRRWDEARVDQLDIRLHADTAIVVGRWQASGQNGADPFDYQARFLSIWLRQDGRWQNLAYEATEMAEGGN